MKNETLSDSTLLESTLQTLRSIARATRFNDGTDKMIMADWAGVADSEVRLIESKLRLRRVEEAGPSESLRVTLASIRELKEDMKARTDEQIERDEESVARRNE